MIFALGTFPEPIKEGETDKRSEYCRTDNNQLALILDVVDIFRAKDNTWNRGGLSKLKSAGPLGH